MSKPPLRFVVFFVLSLHGFTSMAWDGYDYQSGTYVEIGKGNLVRPGRDIEIYEYGRGYKDVTVESVQRYGGSVEVEVYDYSTGEYRVLEMDD